MDDIEMRVKMPEAKKDFNKACELYREYVGGAETMEERKRRIHRFRCGG